MVEKTVRVYLCNKCGKEGKRYTILYEDGTLRFDRCETHARKLEGLRTEDDGDWEPRGAKRSSEFKKSSITDLREAVARGSLEKDQDK